ncbi:hypothetical protein FGO68_gene14961 [Halteria grandinella]|uniref:TLDc domain-containing protein n=1 Tax=Halteria grandinella TaxID=5974 RepID=A0A8J8NKB3_HALGN|nr:hypothetical protein FGO68_gene14961 [Halteria grandinella]
MACCIVIAIILFVGLLASTITLGVLYANEKKNNSSQSDDSAYQLDFTSKLITSDDGKAFISSLFTTSEVSEKPTSLKLLYRGSEDGWARSRYHQVVDNKGPIFSIVQVKETLRICGGFQKFGVGSNVAINNFRSDPGRGIVKGIFEYFVYSLDSKQKFNYVNNFYGNSSYWFNAYANDAGVGWDQGWGLAIPVGGAPNLNDYFSSASYIGFGYNINPQPNTEKTSILTGVEYKFTVKEIEVFSVLY